MSEFKHAALPGQAFRRGKEVSKTIPSPGSRLGGFPVFILEQVQTCQHARVLQVRQSVLMHND